MDFEWMHSPADLTEISAREIEEAFEDPFSIRLLPDWGEEPAESRFFLLGRSISGRGLFIVFWTDGKRYRVIQVRPLTDAETGFYERRNAELGN